MTQTTRRKNTAKQLFVSKIEYWEVPFVGLKLALDDWIIPSLIFSSLNNDQFKVLDKIVCALCITHQSTCCRTPSRHQFVSVLALQRQTMRLSVRLTDWAVMRSPPEVRASACMCANMFVCAVAFYLCFSSGILHIWWVKLRAGGSIWHFQVQMSVRQPSSKAALCVYWCNFPSSLSSFQKMI